MATEWCTIHAEIVRIGVHTLVIRRSYIDRIGARTVVRECIGIAAGTIAMAVANASKANEISSLVFPFFLFLSPWGVGGSGTARMPG